MAELQNVEDQEFRPGDKLQIYLNTDDIIYGEVTIQTKKGIDLKNIQDKDHQKMFHSLSLHYREIYSVRVIERTARRQNEASSSSTAHKIELTDTEYDRLQQMSLDYIFICDRNDDYFKAIDYLNFYESIGLVGLGKMPDITLLIVTTWDQVYIFDFQKLDSVDEIKSLLKSKKVTKIIHHGKPLLQALREVHQISTRNVFDTQIADKVIRKRRTPKEEETEIKPLDLLHCLRTYFDFPVQVLRSAECIEDDDWTVRPFRSDLLERGALLGVYLTILKSCLEEKLLEPLNKSIECVHDFYSCLDDFEFLQRNKETTLPGVVDSFICDQVKKSSEEQYELMKSPP